MRNVGKAHGLRRKVLAVLSNVAWTSATQSISRPLDLWLVGPGPARTLLGYRNSAQACAVRQRDVPDPSLYIQHLASHVSSKKENVISLRRGIGTCLPKEQAVPRAST